MTTEHKLWVLIVSNVAMILVNAWTMWRLRQGRKMLAEAAENLRASQKLVQKFLDDLAGQVIH